ncbi:MAG: hypothetical protein JSS05_10540 [Proteobacteria bacterium]|nr:hypothetical protein [Pseudomonadota bacterium]
MLGASAGECDEAVGSAAGDADVTARPDAANTHASPRNGDRAPVGVNNFLLNAASMTGFAPQNAKNRLFAILRVKPVMDAICTKSCFIKNPKFQVNRHPFMVTRIRRARAPPPAATPA